MPDLRLAGATGVRGRSKGN